MRFSEMEISGTMSPDWMRPHDLISTGDVDVDMAADHGTGQLRAGAVVDDLNVLLHFGNVTAKRLPGSASEPQSPRR